RISSGQGPDGNGTRVHLNIDPGQRTLLADLDGVLNFDSRAPRFEGAMTLVAPPVQKGKGNDPPWRIAAKVKTDYSAARLEQIEVTYGPEERALKLSGSGDIRFGAELLLRAALSARQLDADRFVAKENAKDNATEPVRLRGDVTVAPERFAIDAMKADIEGGTVEGRVVVSHRQVDRGSRIDAELKAERLDLDAATAFARSLAGPQGEWPEEGRLSL